MPRTSPPLVHDVIAIADTIDVDPFIRTATALVDWLEEKDGAQDNILTDALLQEIETYLAAHFYSHRDQLLQSKNTGRAGGTFQGQTQMGLRSTQYGQAAIDLDVTGILAALSKTERPRARVRWLGKENQYDSSDHAQASE